MKKNKIILIILGLIVFCLGGYFIFDKYKFLEKLGFIKNNKNEVEIIMIRISEVMILPKEIPTIAIVSDKSKLKNQVFFDKAENGDKLLLFTNSNLAIIYRESIGKIIQISQISVATDPTPKVEKNEIKINVAILNGSQKIGQASKFEKEIIDKVGEFKVVKKADAKNNYEKSLVIDVSGNYPEVAKSLAQSIGGEVVLLPEGEVKFDSDLMVIIGENW